MVISPIYQIKANKGPFLMRFNGYKNVKAQRGFTSLQLELLFSFDSFPLNLKLAKAMWILFWLADV